MQVSVNVFLIVKADSEEEARQVVIDRLNKWFLDGPYAPPYPPGTLLHYGMIKTWPQEIDLGNVKEANPEGPLGCPGTERDDTENV